jgi:hypothetical protein
MSTARTLADRQQFERGGIALPCGTIAVPAVTGTQRSIAEKAILDMPGLKLGMRFSERIATVPSGIVVGQAPSAGMNVVEGTAVHLWVSSGLGVAGDINGSGKVDCSDLKTVSASGGKKAGQAGFDVRADVNGDGMVDIKDLRFVADKLASGSLCP